MKLFFTLARLRKTDENPKTSPIDAESAQVWFPSADDVKIAIVAGESLTPLGSTLF
jgi:hypothetical protein